jgi:hypothetical protein
MVVANQSYPALGSNQSFSLFFIRGTLLAELYSNEGYLYSLLKILLEEYITNRNWFYLLLGQKKPAEIRYGPVTITGPAWLYRSKGNCPGFYVQSYSRYSSRHYHILQRLESPGTNRAMAGEAANRIAHEGSIVCSLRKLSIHE